MDSEAFEVLSVGGVEEVVIPRPDYDPNWVRTADGRPNWDNISVGIGFVATEDITVERIIHPEGSDAA